MLPKAKKHLFLITLIFEKTFLSFNLDPFATLLQNIIGITCTSPKLLNLNREHSSKKSVFLVKLSCDNLSCENAKPWSDDHLFNITWVTWQNFVGDFIDRNYNVIIFISNHLYFKKPEVANFAHIINVSIMLIKTTFKGSIKV